MALGAKWVPQQLLRLPSSQLTAGQMQCSAHVLVGNDYLLTVSSKVTQYQHNLFAAEQDTHCLVPVTQRVCSFPDLHDISSFSAVGSLCSI